MISISELQERINNIFGDNRFIVNSVFHDGKHTKCNLYCPVCKEENERRVAHVLAGHKCKKCGSFNNCGSFIPLAEKQEIINKNIKSDSLVISYKYEDDVSAQIPDSRRQYSLHCKTCGSTWEKDWSSISRYKKCPFCLRADRSIAAQRPELVRYFIDKREAKMLAAQSGKKVKLICPFCGTKKKMIVGNLYKKGFSCDVCGTGKSFPERFMTSILIGNGVEYETQYSPDWACGRKYDFYLPDHNIIIETHGMQHYQDVASFYGSVEERQKIDQIKEQEAKSHGYRYYIVNCAHSNMDYIEESMKNIGLINDLHLIITDDQRKKAYVDDEKSRCWKLYDEGKDIRYLAKMFHHDIREIREYLKTGAKLGLCTYQKYRKVAQVNIITGEIENVFDMIKDASNYLKIPRTTVARWCNQGGKILYKDKYRIIWLDDYDKYFSQEEDAA